MNSHLYLPRNRAVDCKINTLIKNYGLTLSYNERNEKIYKNEDIIVSLKKSYIFMHAISGEKDFITEMHSFLKDGYKHA